MLVKLTSITEAEPGLQWKALFDRCWPLYRKWFTSEGLRIRPGYLSSVSALEKHMPELLPVYRKLEALAGGSDMSSRFLSLYCPPPYLSGCSQMAWNQGGTALVRNYDYSPKLFEGVLLHSSWLKPVIAMTDCLWGALDGMNASGLAVSLTFGGRQVIGKGFGIPLVLRYILETCDTTEEAVAVLQRVPVHMSYNVTLIDRQGHIETAYLAPDRKPLFTGYSIGTNHQGQVEWPDYAALTQTVERRYYLEQCLLQETVSLEEMRNRFLQAPLYVSRFDRSYGTLYNVTYRPDLGTAEVRWPSQSILQSFKYFNPGITEVNLLLKRPAAF